MEQINGKQKPSSDDYFRVTNAASVLASQACTVSAKHIQDGMLRLQFNREVAYYARGIVRDVAEGRKSAEWGLKELKKKIKDIVEQSQHVAKYAIWLRSTNVKTRGATPISLHKVRFHKSIQTSVCPGFNA
ncbi:hypothetical protein QN386_10850 [Pseudomonas sp. CCI3.2]|nr:MULTISPECIES: hypothetical protein [unclassified Pseudomonas]MEB0077619.1 hypothetical protein [Pseudomonas sp. MH10out]MEB0101816.1 hypothetical protein [Pseudomonas sp. CCI3.2]MEB0121234.1 hypothetical protein [Pseudomonas sp. CCI1.2]MEB0133422.1 hypothetical protein [Pseudomonas sp. CCI2.4]MEB0157663.1 hypothetical protein [Pseudomonas sp. AH2 (2023)]MEB0166905.1 hypothetical protein [Pseudomonas sp. CCC4.4]